MLEQTVLRLHGFVKEQNIFIITNQSFVEQIRGLCSQLPPENIIGEPYLRDTAPCMALAAGIVKASAKTENPVMMLLPSDHYITNRNAMISDFRICVRTAVKHDAIATIGIVPNFPSTEYGYIECGDRIDGESDISMVKRFREKPSKEIASELIASGKCKWNSGMFIFPIQTIRREMKKNAPDLLELSDRIAGSWKTSDFQQVFAHEYESVRKISVDYAIMEHAERVIEKDATFEWDDIGNWTALRNHFRSDSDGNVHASTAFLMNCKNCITFSNDKSTVVAGIDLENIVLIRTEDAVLACPVGSISKIKSLLSEFSKDTEFRKFL